MHSAVFAALPPSFAGVRLLCKTLPRRRDGPRRQRSECSVVPFLHDE
jgi:hypothetical protein